MVCVCGRFPNALRQSAHCDCLQCPLLFLRQRVGIRNDMHRPILDLDDGCRRLAVLCSSVAMDVDETMGNV